MVKNITFPKKSRQNSGDCYFKSFEDLKRGKGKEGMDSGVLFLLNYLGEFV